MAAPKIHYSQYTPENDIKSNITSKTSKETIDPATGEKKSPAPYHEIPMQHRYKVLDSEGKETFVIGNLRVEGPSLKSSSGLSKAKKPSSDGKGFYYEYTIFVSFDLTQKDQSDFVGRHDESFMTKLLKSCYARVFEFRGAVGLGKINDPVMMPAVFTEPIYWSRDKATGIITEGKRPVKFLKVFHYDFNGNTRKAIFSTPLDEKPVIDDWSELENVELTFTPVFHFRKIHVGGGKVSVIFEIESAVVTDISPAGALSSQADTIEAAKKNTAAVDKLRASMASLQLARDRAKEAAEAAKTANSSAQQQNSNQQKTSVLSGVSSTSNSDSLLSQPEPSSIFTHSGASQTRIPDLSALLAAGPTVSISSASPAPTISVMPRPAINVLGQNLPSL